MKQLNIIVLFVGLTGLFTACETEIHPQLEDAESLVAVDAWINDKPAAQVIKVMLSQSYLDNTLPPAVSGATVTVENQTTGNVFAFTESADEQGSYVWTPVKGVDSLGTTGDNFRLLIQANGETYEGFSAMGRVPAIDSVSFTFQPKNAIQPDSYMAEFWAVDPAGQGDTYWIRATRNDTLLNKPSEISLAYDAGFSNGGNFDGIEFLPPIRSSINPFEQDADKNILSPYNPGDSVYVELYSITLSAFNYLTQVAVQTNRPGGFAELFATPLANVSTNIVNVNPNGKPALGFFNVAKVSGAGKRLVKN